MRASRWPHKMKARAARREIGESVFMFARNPQLRYLWPVALTSLLLLGLCVFVAAFLLRQQSASERALHANLAKRRAAADLTETTIDLIGLLRNRVEKVGAIHDRIDRHLERIRNAVASSSDSDQAGHLLESYQRYFDLWKDIEQPGGEPDLEFRDAAAWLESDTLPLCQNLVESSTREMERSEEEHSRAISWLAWGMGGVGLLGAGAGLVLGYGVARGLSRSIHHLQVRVQDAAGKIGPKFPEIVVTGEGDLGQLEGQMQELVDRIEKLVKKLQQREWEVLHAEQLAAVGQLAAGVAHEIRNPLTSIKMLVQAGREDANGLPPEDLEIIEREALRMERSLKVFLDFARLPKPERREQDLNSIASRTFDLIRGRAAKQQVELKLTHPDGPLRIEADGEQIRQVLVNLSLNALDVMPSGGRLEMIVRPFSESIEVLVLDTGPGIAPEMMPRLFEPFVSTKETGLGLGLVISRRIVEEHNGRLFAANRTAGGACFTMNLPLGTSCQPC